MNDNMMKNGIVKKYGIINPIHLIDKKVFKFFSRDDNIAQVNYDLIEPFKAIKTNELKSLFHSTGSDAVEEVSKSINRLIQEIEAVEIETLIFSSEFLQDLMDEEVEDKQLLETIDLLIHNICLCSAKVLFVAEEEPLGLIDDAHRREKYVKHLDKILGNLFDTENAKCYIVRTAFGEGDFYDKQKMSLDIELLKNQHATLADELAQFLLYNVDSDQKVIRIHESLDLDSAVNIKSHQSRCSFKLIYQLKPDEYFCDKLVCKERITLGEELANSVPENVIKEIDFVTPVPNTGTYYAMGLAMKLCKPYIQGIMKKAANERSFQIADSDKRKKFLWSKIKPIPELVEGKTIAVVDEAIFTGSTLKVVCEMLRHCNVKKIYLCIPTPKCRYHCDYLVHPDRPMLLEYLSENVLNDYFDVDGIFFQSDLRFKSVLESVKDNLCVECFLGRSDRL